MKTMIKSYLLIMASAFLISSAAFADDPPNAQNLNFELAFSPFTYNPDGVYSFQHADAKVSSVAITFIDRYVPLSNDLPAKMVYLASYLFGTNYALTYRFEQLSPYYTFEAPLGLPASSGAIGNSKTLAQSVNEYYNTPKREEGGYLIYRDVVATALYSLQYSLTIRPEVIYTEGSLLAQTRTWHNPRPMSNYTGVDGESNNVIVMSSVVPFPMKRNEVPVPTPTYREDPRN